MMMVLMRIFIENCRTPKCARCRNHGVVSRFNMIKKYYETFCDDDVVNNSCDKSDGVFFLLRWSLFTDLQQLSFLHFYFQR